MLNLSDFTLKIFADGADLAGIKAMAAHSYIKGFTTNPTLMRKAGVKDYQSFAHDVLSVVTHLPVSFEVFADEFDEMERQANEIASWGTNVNVKVPVTNTRKEFSGPLIRRLNQHGVQLNVTAVMTVQQIQDIVDCLETDTPAIISVFAGRIADTGVDPIPIMREAVQLMSHKPNVELLWASPRELLNVVQANEVGCHILTATNDILKKLFLLGKDHTEYSLETVQMFYDDALAAGFQIVESCQPISV